MLGKAWDWLRALWTGLSPAELEKLCWDASPRVPVENRREKPQSKCSVAVDCADSERGRIFLFFLSYANMCVSSFHLLAWRLSLCSPQGEWFWGRETTRHWHPTVWRVSGSSCLFSFFLSYVFAAFWSCHGVPSSQMDAVKRLNDACFPSWALAIVAVYMQSNRQASCNSHPRCHTPHSHPHSGARHMQHSQQHKLRFLSFWVSGFMSCNIWVTILPLSVITVWKHAWLAIEDCPWVCVNGVCVCPVMDRWHVQGVVPSMGTRHDNIFCSGNDI